MANIAENITSKITLNDGVVMPLFGLGVYKASGDETVTFALKNGYRLIDTAAIYRNEEEVGKAIKNSGINREDIFVVTKAWTNEHGYDDLKEGFKKSLARLGTSYVDLYLIHSPRGAKLVQTFKAMCDLKNEGFIRSVGVSNFGIHHLKGLKEAGLPTPSINQIELHPWMRRDELVNYCREEGITVMGYSPMAKGKRFGDPLIRELSQKYNKTEAQLMIRWSVQHGYITIPKSSLTERIMANSQVFDWSIEAQDFQAMNVLKEESISEWNTDQNGVKEETCMGDFEPWDEPFVD